MNTSVLRIVAADRPPFVFYNGARTDFKFTGMLVDLLPTLLGYAQINPRLEYYNAPSNEGGTQLANGTWTGIMGELTHGEADISLFPLLLIGNRPDYVDMTYSFLDGGTTVLVRTGTYSPSVFGFLAPFSWQVWISLLFAVIGVTMFYHMLSWASPFGNYDAMRLRKTKAHASEVRKYVVEARSESPLSEALLSMMGAPCVPQGSSWSHRFLQLAWAFFSLVLLNTYTAGLAALFTVQSLTQTYNSLEDVANSTTATVAIVPSDAAYKYAVGGDDGTRDDAMQRLAPRLRLYNNVIASKNAVANGSVTAALGEYYNMQYWAGTLPCNLSVVGSPFGPGNLVFGLRKGSPYTAALNSAILQLRGNGVIDQLKRRWVDDLDQCDDISAQYGGGALRIQTIQGVFFMLLLFIVISFLWVGGEHWAMWLNAKYPKQTGKIRAFLDWFDRYNAKEKRFSVLRKFHSARWSARKTMALRSISAGRRASSSSAGGSESGASSARSTADLGTHRKTATRTSSDLKAAFLRSWRRSDIELTPTSAQAPAPIGSPLDDLRELAIQGAELARPSSAGATLQSSASAAADGRSGSSAVNTTIGQSDSALIRRFVPSGGPQVGELVSDEVAALIGSYGRAQ